MRRLLAFVLLANTRFYCTYAKSQYDICINNYLFGNDIFDRLFVSRPLRPSPIIPPFKVQRRDDIDDAIETVIAAGSGPINFSDIFGIGKDDGGDNKNKDNNKTGDDKEGTKDDTKSAITKTDEDNASITDDSEQESEQDSTESALDKSSQESSEVSDLPHGPQAGGYAQDPSDGTYTCKHEFVDFSKEDSMSKFVYEWCPQNAYQSDNSVIWRLTSECGTTMVYPWDFQYGKIEARIRIAPGDGVVTTILLLGPAPSDEIDFEWVGKDPHGVQTTYYVQAQRVAPMSEAIYIQDSGSSDLSTRFHNYALELNKDTVKWYIDDNLVRTVPKTGSVPFPSEANRARMGVWDGTQTSGWAGTVNWGDAPFMAEMQWFNFTPYC